MNKTIALAGAAAVAAAAACAWFSGCSGESGGEGGETRPGAAAPERKGADAAEGRGKAAAAAKKRAKPSSRSTVAVKEGADDAAKREILAELAKLDADAAAEGESAAAVEEILRLVKELGMTREQALAHWRLGRLMAAGGAEECQEALRLARRMRFSGDPRSRKAALDALGWAGAQALPEITSMLGDEDPAVAEEAFEKWMTAFNELQDDEIKCEVIVEAAKTFNDDDHMDAIMLELTKVEREMAFDAVAKVIESGDSTVAGVECAKSIFEHMADRGFTGVGDVRAAATESVKATTGDSSGRLEWLMERSAAAQQLQDAAAAEAAGGEAAAGGGDAAAAN